jgi:hypothetical protein
VVIPFYDKYPLQSQKRADFELFKLIIELIKNQEHMTQEGMQKIIDIKASLNTGNSDELKAIFPNTKPVTRPVVKYTGIPDPH